MDKIGIPGAIVLGFVLLGMLVGAGVFWGLKTRTETSPRNPAAAVPNSAAVGAPRALAGPAVPAAVAPPAPTSDEVQLEVAAQLAAARPAILAKCWDAKAAREQGVVGVRYVLDLTIDPAGTQVMRGMSAGQDASVPSIDTCVGEALPTFTANTGGVTRHFNVTLTLP